MSLTDKQIRFARRRYSMGGVSQRELAELLGISQTYLFEILTGRVRPQAGGPLHTPAERTFSAKQVVAIRRAYGTGRVTQAELAEKHGVDIATMSRLLRGETYADAGGPISEGALLAPRSTKLTARQLEHVLRSKEGHSELARRYGVSRQLIQQLRRRWGWSY
jgi:transcriptional regulator with XRE-family HTH domain